MAAGRRPHCCSVSKRATMQMLWPPLNATAFGQIGSRMYVPADDRFHRSWAAEPTSAPLQVGHDAVLAADPVVSKQARARNQMWTDRANRSCSRTRRDTWSRSRQSAKQTSAPGGTSRGMQAASRRVDPSFWLQLEHVVRAARAPGSRGKHVSVSRATDQHERLEDGWLCGEGLWDGELLSRASQRGADRFPGRALLVGHLLV